MKNLINKSTFVLILLIQLSGFSQDFASIGTKWYYTSVGTHWAPEISPVIFESVSEETILGKKCMKIEVSANSSTCSYASQSPHHVYYEDSSVFFYEKSLGKFQKLYDFKAIAGDSWSFPFHGGSQQDTIHILVDSVGSELINGKLYKALFVTYSSKWSNEDEQHSKIIERIGDIELLFYWTVDIHTCDFGYWRDLRCFHDSVIGTYKTGSAPTCDYSTVGFNEFNNSNIVNIYPNPANNNLTIKSSQEINEIYLISSLGIKTQFEIAPNGLLEIESLSNGIYTLRIDLKDAVILKKLVVNH